MYLRIVNLFTGLTFHKTAEFVTADGVFGILPDMPIGISAFSAVSLNHDEILFMARKVVSIAFAFKNCP